MKYPELKTIRDFIRFAASKFTEAGLYFGHGTDNGWDEAVRLVMHTLHLPHNAYEPSLEANLTKSEQQKVLELIELRISKRIPVPYLTHQAWFCGLPFYVDERVLIPRSSIGELIEDQFQPWIMSDDVTAILDLCTGSGCIAIACAKVFPSAQIDASDISADALAVAKINTLKHRVQDQVHLYQSDLFASIPKQKYDIIVSNPPYVSTKEMIDLPAEYLHEPSLGLGAGTKGLNFVNQILRQAAEYLSPHGILVMEVGNSEHALTETFPNIPFTWLNFEHSEGGVFLLTTDQLKAQQF